MLVLRANSGADVSWPHEIVFVEREGEQVMCLGRANENPAHAAWLTQPLVCPAISRKHAEVRVGVDGGIQLSQIGQNGTGVLTGADWIKVSKGETCALSRGCVLCFDEKARGAHVRGDTASPMPTLYTLASAVPSSSVPASEPSAGTSLAAAEPNGSAGPSSSAAAGPAVVAEKRKLSMLELIAEEAARIDQLDGLSAQELGSLHPGADASCASDPGGAKTPLPVDDAGAGESGARPAGSLRAGRRSRPTTGSAIAPIELGESQDGGGQVVDADAHDLIMLLDSQPDPSDVVDEPNRAKPSSTATRPSGKGKMRATNHGDDGGDGAPAAQQGAPILIISDDDDDDDGGGGDGGGGGGGGGGVLKPPGTPPGAHAARGVAAGGAADASPVSAPPSMTRNPRNSV